MTQPSAVSRGLDTAAAKARVRAELRIERVVGDVVGAA